MFCPGDIVYNGNSTCTSYMLKSDIIYIWTNMTDINYDMQTNNTEWG